MSQQQQPIMPPTQPSHVPPKKRKTIDLPIPVFVLMIVGILIALMVGMFWAGFSYEGELAADKSEISRLTRELDAAKAKAAPSDSSDQNQPEDNSTTVPDGIEIISIEDKGSEYGYRNVSITVKNNLNTQLSNVFINFSIEDQAGNSVDTGQAGTTAQLLPGATAMLDATIEDDGSLAGKKIVPAQWIAMDGNNTSGNGNYKRNVVTGTLN